MTRTLVFLLAVLTLLPPALAQFGQPGIRRPPQQQPNRKKPGQKLDKFEADGTLVAMAPGKLMLQTVTNQKWMIHLTQETKVFVRGTAETSFLQPGLCVQFDAMLDKRGKAQEKVTQLTLTTPSQMNPPGCWPAAQAMAMQAAAAAAAAAQKGGHGAAMPGVGMPGPAPVAPPAGPGGKPPLVQSYRVHGQISKLKDGKMLVVCPGAKIEVEVDENAAIAVAVANIAFAKQGDRINVKGGMPPQMAMLRPGMIGAAQANEIEIDMQAPLKGVKKPVRRMPVKPGAKKPDEKEKAAPDAKKPADGAAPAGAAPAGADPAAGAPKQDGFKFGEDK